MRSQPHSSVYKFLVDVTIAPDGMAPFAQPRTQPDSEAKPSHDQAGVFATGFEVNSHTSSGPSPAALALSSPPRSAVLSLTASGSMSLQDVGCGMLLQ